MLIRLRPTLVESKLSLAKQLYMLKTIQYIKRLKSCDTKRIKFSAKLNLYMMTKQHGVTVGQMVEKKTTDL